VRLAAVTARISARYPVVTKVVSKRVAGWWWIDATIERDGRVVTVRATEKTAEQCLRALGV
jgi:hypothetical protein